MNSTLTDFLATAVGTLLTGMFAYYVAALVRLARKAWLAMRGEEESEEEQQGAESPGSIRPVTRWAAWTAALISGTVILWFAWKTHSPFSGKGVVHFAKASGGEYARYQGLLEREIERRKNGAEGIQFSSLTSGSVETATNIANGFSRSESGVSYPVEAGIIQANSRTTHPDGHKVLAVASLFDEYFMCVARTGENTIFSSDNGKLRTLERAAHEASRQSPPRKLRVAAFGVQSRGQNGEVKYESKTLEDLDAVARALSIRDKIEIIACSEYEVALAKLQLDPISGADCAFFITGLGNTHIATKFQYTLAEQQADPWIQFVKLGNTETLKMKIPGTSIRTIPEDFFLGSRLYETISTQAVLACSSDLSTKAVYNLAKWAHQSQSAIRHDFVGLDVSDPRRNLDIPFETHPGAERYFSGRQLSFVERNQSLIGLTLAFWLLLALASFVSGVIFLYRIESLVEQVAESEDGLSGVLVPNKPKPASKPTETGIQESLTASTTES